MNVAIRHGAGLAAVVLGLGVIAAGCLTRPVEHADPVTKTNVSIQVPNQAVDKIDMLFDIDNSASMGDKQTYLAQAIPQLIDRLVTPNCVDTATQTMINGTVMNGTCPAGFKPEFPAVHDMHIGVVTSSLGTRLSDSPAPRTPDLILCNPNAMTVEYPTLSAHNDDRGELIQRQLTNAPADAPVPDAATSGYLYYFPTGAGTGPDPAINLPVTLEADFGNIVHGAGIFGCGIESQLESWYRFLIQPDPYAQLVLNPANCSGNTCRAGWSGVDTTILKQRHDFLRPDSLVVVVVLSDENDSEIDVRSLNGQGYLFMHEDFNPPHGTSICATNPDDPGCQSCPPTSTDPACTPNRFYTASNDWGFDPNLRHVHMKAKYGLDPQFPISRYYFGLTSTVVPDRDGEYPAGAGGYVGCVPDASNTCLPNCTNPLFAAHLPDGSGALDSATLCKLPVGQRANQKSNIFYAHIGGVPNQLLHFHAADLANSQLTQADWVRILGTSAANYTVDNRDYNGPHDVPHDYTGIDPHMIESYQDRSKSNIAVDTSLTSPVAPATMAPNTPDMVNGREWTTDVPLPMVNANMVQVGHVLSVDREYACTFPLATPRDCKLAANQNSCDCPQDATGLPPDAIPPLCDPANPTSQIAAKAYPTIRELLLAKLMASQGIVASLCPIHVAAQGANDPLYGYNPAVAVIVDRLKTALNSQCLPEKLGSTDGGNGAVPCLVLVGLAPDNGGTCKNPVCDVKKGLYGPNVATNSPSNPPLDQAVLNKFCDTQEANYVANGGATGAVGDPANQSVCMLYQLTPSDPNGATEFSNGSCANYMPVASAGGGGGWCYVTGAAANGCPQAVQFSNGSPPAGSVTYLQCIEESISVVGAGH